MYKSENRNNQHYFLLYDEEAEHYDCITDIKAFLACRCFCYRCLSTFLSKDAFDNHTCNTEKLKKTNNKNKGKMVKELSYYLTQNYTKESKE